MPSVAVINRARTGALALALAAIALAAIAASAHAAFGLHDVSALVSSGPSEPRATQAGSSPYEASVTVKLNETAEVPDGSPKTIVAELPAGFVGNPTATPTRCTREQFASLDPNTGLLPLCPASSQVGFAHFSLTGGANLSLPIFNLEPTPGTPAQFGVLVLSTPVIATAKVRPGDHGVSVEFRDIPQTLGMRESTYALWGVPADPRHDFLRNNVCLPDPSGFCFLPGMTASAPPKPFLRLPSDCEVGLQRTTLRADQWADPGAYVSTSFDHDVNGQPLESTGCERLAFDPSLRVQPTATQADAPSGLQVALSFPQNEDPTGLGTPPLRRATVTLPEGMSINPASAAGLAACTDAELGLGTDEPVACPESAKIGSISAVSPLLENPIGGAVYLRTQNSSDPQSGEMFRLALVLSDPERGLLIKLPGQVRADPSSGQLTTTFDDNPQLPVSAIQLNLKAGPRAALAMPDSCGVKTTAAQLTSWAGQVAELHDSFSIPCPTGGRFAPRFDAGSVNPIAGATAPFAVRVGREDGEQPLGSVTTQLPSGLSAYLKGVPYCSESAIAAAGRSSGAAEQSSPGCPAASQIGTVNAGAGAGEPFNVGGRVYLAGPYKGAPLSLAVITPALAGPFDLGTVVVRAALQVNPVTAEITAVSDPLPQIVRGVPLRLRAIDLSVNRPGFTLNPTSCDPMSVTGSIASAQGKVANPSSRFQVTNCAALGFKPSLKLKVSGPTKRGKYPKLRAELKAPPGQANIGKVSVALPHSEFLAQEHIKTICTRVQYSAQGGGGKACPAGSVYGWARAFTPLLDQPLEGPVFLRSSSNPLPDLVASLDGQIHIDLAGRIDSVNGGIRNTFESVPDAPVSKFVLTMQGGKKSLLVNSRNLCATTNRATVKMDGQNGKVHDFRPLVGNSCKGKVKRK